MIKHKPFTKTTILVMTFMVGLVLALVLPWIANIQTSAAASQNEMVIQGAPEADNKYYVAKTGDGSDGLSWTKAFTNVQDALTAVDIVVMKSGWRAASTHLGLTTATVSTWFPARRCTVDLAVRRAPRATSQGAIGLPTSPS